MADIKSHASLTTSLVSYWDLEEADGTRYDLHGSNDLTQNGTGGVDQATGKVGNAADFERGDSDYLSITDASQSGLDITGDISVSFWMKLESAPAFDTIYSILNKRNTGSSNGGYQIQYTHFPSNTDTLQIVFYDGSSNTSSVAALDLNLSTATWYHLVITIDVSAPDIKVYLDGSDQSFSMSLTDATAIGDNAEEFRIGRTAAGDYFDGQIDEVGIWSKVLTSGEVTDLYNSGSGLPYWDPDDVKNETTLSTSLVSYWEMEQTAGNDATDSHASNDMTDVNDVGSTTGILGNSAVFNGTDEYFTANHATLKNENAYTLSWWAYRPTSATSSDEMFSTNQAGSHAGDVWTLFQASGSVEMIIDNGAGSDALTDGVNYEDDSWHHFVWTGDGTNMYKYVDGVQTDTTASTINWNGDSQEIKIGRSATGTNYFEGRMDEIAFWNKALTVGEIRALNGYGTPPVYEAASTFTPRVMMY
jgi:hypothetical protein